MGKTGFKGKSTCQTMKSLQMCLIIIYIGKAGYKVRKLKRRKHKEQPFPTVKYKNTFVGKSIEHY